MTDLGWADHEEVVGDMAKDLATITHRILTLQSDFEAALKRENTLVVAVVRWLEMAEGSPKWQHLADTVPFRCCECGGQLVVVEDMTKGSRYWCVSCHAWHTPEAVWEHLKAKPHE